MKPDQPTNPPKFDAENDYEPISFDDIPPGTRVIRAKLIYPDAPDNAYICVMEPRPKGDADVQTRPD